MDTKQIERNKLDAAFAVTGPHVEDVVLRAHQEVLEKEDDKTKRDYIFRLQNFFQKKSKTFKSKEPFLKDFMNLYKKHQKEIMQTFDTSLKYIGTSTAFGIVFLVSLYYLVAASHKFTAAQYPKNPETIELMMSSLYTGISIVIYAIHKKMGMEREATAFNSVARILSDKQDISDSLNYHRKTIEQDIKGYKAKRFG
jgi:hypothetical protein